MVDGDGFDPFNEDIGVAYGAQYTSAKVLDEFNSSSSASIVIAGARRVRGKWLKRLPGAILSFRFRFHQTIYFELISGFLSSLGSCQIFLTIPRVGLHIHQHSRRNGMKVSLVILSALVLLLGLAGAGLATCWEDDFDSYANGSGIAGQGGWACWDDNPEWDGYVTNFVSRSAPHSLEITPTTDVVQLFTGLNVGQWIITAWQYIPSTATGDQYFILLNTYNHGGPYNWSTTILFSGGVAESQNEGTQLPLVYDQWVEVRVEIDLDIDLQTIYYNGDLLSIKSWTEGLSGGGAVDIACLDLYSNGGDSIYWDDVSVVGIVTAVEPSTWSVVKSLF